MTWSRDGVLFHTALVTIHLHCMATITLYSVRYLCGQELLLCVDLLLLPWRHLLQLAEGDVHMRARHLKKSAFAILYRTAMENLCLKNFKGCFKELNMVKLCCQVTYMQLYILYVVCFLKSSNVSWVQWIKLWVDPHSQSLIYDLLSF